MSETKTQALSPSPHGHLRQNEKGPRALSDSERGASKAEVFAPAIVFVLSPLVMGAIASPAEVAIEVLGFWTFLAILLSEGLAELSQRYGVAPGLLARMSFGTAGQRWLAFAFTGALLVAFSSVMVSSFAAPLHALLDQLPEVATQIVWVEHGERLSKLSVFIFYFVFVAVLSQTRSGTFTKILLGFAPLSLGLMLAAIVFAGMRSKGFGPSLSPAFDLWSGHRVFLWMMPLALGFRSKLYRRPRLRGRVARMKFRLLPLLALPLGVMVVHQIHRLWAMASREVLGATQASTLGNLAGFGGVLFALAGLFALLTLSSLILTVLYQDVSYSWLETAFFSLFMKHERWLRLIVLGVSLGTGFVLVTFGQPTHWWWIFKCLSLIILIMSIDSAFGFRALIIDQLQSKVSMYGSFRGFSISPWLALAFHGLFFETIAQAWPTMWVENRNGALGLVTFYLSFTLSYLTLRMTENWLRDILERQAKRRAASPDKKHGLKLDDVTAGKTNPGFIYEPKDDGPAS